MAAGLSGVSAQETILRQVYDTATDTHVEALALFSKPAPGGFLPVRVKIANNLKTDRYVALDCSTGNDAKSNSSFTFSVKANETITRDIMVPTAPQSGYGYNGVNVTMNGTLGMANGSIHSNFNADEPAVLLSEALFTKNASALDKERNSKGSGYRGSSDFAGQFDPKQLPDNWLAFSGYDSVLMTDTDWSNVPPGGRNAILSWVRLGGQLVVFSSSSPSPSSLGLPDEAGYGSISIKNIEPSLDLPPPQTVKLVDDNPVRSRQKSIRDDFQSSWPLQLAFGQQAFRYGMFVVVMVIFAIVVGPVNLFVLAKSGRRHRLFITTPLISLAASLVLVALILVQDGLGGNGMRRVLMEVRPDGDVNAAFLHQEQFSRTGVLTRGNFTIDTPVNIQPVPIASSRWARYTSSSQSGAFHVQPEDGKLKASGTWFESRSEQGQFLSAVVPTRGRIEKTDTPDTMLSTFDFPIEKLYYKDEADQWHVANAVEPGKRFTLTPLHHTMALPALAAEVNSYTVRNKMMLQEAVKRPGHFVAVTAAAPGVDTNPGIRWAKTSTIITGPVVAP